MKNFTLALSIVFISACTVFSYGQTVITYSNHAPLIGYSATVKSIPEVFGVDVGPDGAGVSWDFTQYEGAENVDYDFVDPQNTPYASMVSGCNVAQKMIDGAQYHFFEGTSQHTIEKGIGQTVDQVNIYNEYPDPWKVMVYPFAFGNSFVDDYHVVLDMNPVIDMQQIIIGTMTVTADGWGTLTNPEGTYSNVLRIKKVHEDSTALIIDGELVNTSSYIYNEYFWYSDSHRNFVQRIYEDVEFAYFTVAYLTGEVAGIEDGMQDMISIYPNPVSNLLFIENNGSMQYDHAEITDVSGRVIKNTAIEGSQQNNSVDLSSLPAGMYFLKLINENAIIAVKKMMVDR